MTLNATSLYQDQEGLVNSTLHTNDTGCNTTAMEVLVKYIPMVIEISRILPPIWWFIGIIGNTLALLVWLQPKMRHSSGCYLAALAVSDLCFLPLNIVYELQRTYDMPLLNQPGLCEWYAVIYLSVQHMSPVLVLAFTVERYLSVCHPFRTSKFNLSNIRVAILVILGLALFCIGLNGVQAYFWTTQEDAHGVLICDLREELYTTNAWIITTWTLEVLISAAVPLTVLFLNVLVIVEVRKISNLERQNMRTNSIDRRSTTLMLLGVSFYLIFTLLPVTIMYALYYLFLEKACVSDEEAAADPGYFHYWGARIIIQNIGMSHYAANFFIYLATGKLFRKQLKELVINFCCKEKLLYFKTKTGIFTNTKTTRMSLTSHRGSVAKNRLNGAKTGSDPCNNDTELGNKNTSALFSNVDAEASTLNGGAGGKYNNAVGNKLLTCVEESDGDMSDKEGEISRKLTP